MSDKCIICLNYKPLTREHIIPESIGGSLVIKALCGACNSDIGRQIDSHFVNHALIQLPRFDLGIAGKSGKIPNPFCKGELDNGLKVNFDERLRPTIIPSIKTELNDDGSYSLVFKVDPKDMGNIELFRKKVYRTIKKIKPEFTEEELNKQTEKYISQVKNILEHTEPQKPDCKNIKFSFPADDMYIKLEFMKIAYEMAFHIFGYSYIEKSKLAKLYREAFIDRNINVPIEVMIGTEDDPYIAHFPNTDKHYIVVMDTVCYVRLFRVWGILKLSAIDEGFHLNLLKDAKVWEFNVSRRSFRELSLVTFIQSGS